jgi:hypothetical protein
MSQNNQEMQSILQDNDTSNRKYVAEVYQTTDAHVLDLEKHIRESQEASQLKVRTGLETAQALGADTSKTNQELLGAFTEKLPYTRLGNTENRVAYTFITDPVLLIQKEIDSYDLGNTAEVNKSSMLGDFSPGGNGEALAENHDWIYRYAFLGLVSVLICITLCKTVLKRIKRVEKKETIS